MNAEAIITALLANLGDIKELVAKSNAIELPRVSQRAIFALKRKFVLLGQAAANERTRKFLMRIKAGMEQEKEASKNVASESQLHSPTGFHLRNQSAFPGSITASKSFGGASDPGGGGTNAKRKHTRVLESRLNYAFGLLEEEIAVRVGDGTSLMAERGQLLVDGEPAITNHADLLKIMVLWMAENEPVALRSAVDSMADMVRSGTVFRT